MNLYKDIPAFADEEKGFLNMVVDIPRGGSNKYEYDEEGGYFKLDRVLYHQMFYPFDYGFVPQTHALDGDAVDVCALLTYPTFPGCVIKVRVIGAMDTADESGPDMKVIAVPVEKLDPRWAEVQTVEDLPEHVRKELLLHFKEIKKLEVEKYPKVEVRGFLSREDALAMIKEASGRYLSHS